MAFNVWIECPTGKEGCRGGFMKVHPDGKSSFLCAEEVFEGKGFVDEEVLGCHDALWGLREMDRLLSEEE